MPGSRTCCRSYGRRTRRARRWRARRELFAVETPAETRDFAVTARDLGLIDDWIEGVGARWQADARTVFAARLCVAELAANVLEHAAATSAPDRITVTLRHCGDAIG